MRWNIFHVLLALNRNGKKWKTKITEIDFSQFWILKSDYQNRRRGRGGEGEEGGRGEGEEEGGEMEGAGGGGRRGQEGQEGGNEGGENEMSENQKSQLVFQFSVFQYLDFLIFLYLQFSIFCFSIFWFSDFLFFNFLSSVFQYFDFLIFLYFQFSNFCFSTLWDIENMKYLIVWNKTINRRIKFLNFTFSVTHLALMKDGNQCENKSNIDLPHYLFIDLGFGYFQLWIWLRVSLLYVMFEWKKWKQPFDDAEKGRGHETCTYDKHNISKNDYLISVNLSRSIDRKDTQCLESDFLSIPSFYINFYDYSKLTPGRWRT